MERRTKELLLMKAFKEVSLSMTDLNNGLILSGFSW